MRENTIFIGMVIGVLSTVSAILVSNQFFLAAFTKLEGRFDKLESRFDKVDAQLNDIRVDLKYLTKRVDQHETRLEKLEGK